MQIEYLDEFLDLAESLSYGATAERFLISESSLSRHIRALERELGAELFERTARRVRLTAAGEAVVPLARSVSSAWQECRQQARQGQAKVQQTIVLGSSYYVNDLVARFCVAHQEITVRQTQAGDATAVLREQLDRGEAQFIVTIEDLDHSGDLRHIVLSEDRYEAVLPEGHRLAGCSRLAVKDLAGESFISFVRDSQGDRALKRICRAAGFEPNILFSAEVGTTIAQFVHEGLGVSLLHAETLAKLPTAPVVRIPLEPDTTFAVRLFWNGSVPLTPAARTFLEFVQARFGLASHSAP